MHTPSHTHPFAGRPHPPALLSTGFGRGASPFPGRAAALGLIMGMVLWHAGGQSTGGEQIGGTLEPQVGASGRLKVRCSHGL